MLGGRAKRRGVVKGTWHVRNLRVDPGVLDEGWDTIDVSNSWGRHCSGGGIKSSRRWAGQQKLTKGDSGRGLKTYKTWCLLL